MMHNAFDDYQTGVFTPDIALTKREDNGHWVASAMGRSATHHDQAEAVNTLSNALREEITAGTLYPGSN